MLIFSGIITELIFFLVSISVVDPVPMIRTNVFGPPGCGSVIILYGSGFGFGSGSRSTDEKKHNPERGTDRRIRIHIKMSRIYNTG